MVVLLVEVSQGKVAEHGREFVVDSSRSLPSLDCEVVLALVVVKVPEVVGRL